MKGNEELLRELTTEALLGGLDIAVMDEFDRDKEFWADLGPIVAEVWLRMRIEQIRFGREDLQFVVQVVVPRENLGDFLSGGTIIGTTFLHRETLREEVKRFAARVKAAIEAVPNTPAPGIDFRIVDVNLGDPLGD